MTVSPLPREFISLVHHVELNKAGWWEKAIQQLITATIWVSGAGNVGLSQVCDDLQEGFGAKVGADQVRRNIQALVKEGVLLELQDSTFKLAEQAEAKLNKDMEDADAIERQARASFDAILGQQCPSLDKEATWNSFVVDCLIPLVKDMGAHVYEMIAQGRARFDAAVIPADFVNSYPAEVQTPLREAIARFLDPGDAAVRNFVLRTLNAYFFIEAGNLTDESIRALAAVSGKPVKLTVFLDTNFLFSILGLQENPSNDAAERLMGLLADLPEHLEVKFYAAPITVDEARDTLQSIAGGFHDLPLAPGLAAAASGVGLASIGQRFLRAVTESGSAISAADFFRPYLEDFVAAMRGKNVELFNVDLDEYRTDQKVIDDIVDRYEHEKRYKRPKGYRAVEHDVVLWHYAKSRRLAVVESPIEAEFWIVTLDFRFIGFDRHKGRMLGSTVPVCIHPATLVQLLQFWVPRTPEFEEAVLGSLRLPFLFQEFDPAAERVTIRILQSLARFENASDLSVETATAVLQNQAVRQRVQGQQDSAGDLELVREALIDQDKGLRDKLRVAEVKASQLQETVGALEATVGGLEQEAGGRREGALRQNFVLKIALVPFLLIAALWAAAFLPVVVWAGITFWPWPILGGAAAVSAWTVLLRYFGSKQPLIRDWSPFRAFDEWSNRILVGTSAPRSRAMATISSEV